MVRRFSGCPSSKDKFNSRLSILDKRVDSLIPFDCSSLCLHFHWVASHHSPIKSWNETVLLCTTVWHQVLVLHHFHERNARVLFSLGCRSFHWVVHRLFSIMSLGCSSTFPGALIEPKTTYISQNLNIKFR